jgi:predicted RNA-binding Zn ribbon-like protein
VADITSDEVFLLALLNSTPVIDGEPTDILADPGQARAWLVSAGGLGTEAELRQVLKIRLALQAVVRGQAEPDVLSPVLRGVVSVPAITDGQVTWTLRVPHERRLAVRAVLAWDALAKHSPGRLRPCANDECRLFLIDRSKANAARWCSMAICGNRMKARRHYQRGRVARTEPGGG